MKILIIEDNPLHLASAKKFAKKCEREVVIVNNYDDADKALNRPNLGLNEYGDFKFGEFEYEVVMTDLFLPSSHAQLTDEAYERFKNTKQPYGFALAFKAISQGARKVAIITDGNHHNHPMIASMDWFRKNKVIGDATFIVEQMHVTVSTPKNWGALFEKLNS